MKKIADIKTEPKAHQKRVVARIAKQPGLVVAHTMGTGKSLASLLAAEDAGTSTDVVAPASLIPNYKKEIAKHVEDPRADYRLHSMQGLARKRTMPDGKFLIVDEAHRLRDAGSASYQTVAANKAEKRLLLTGTPLYNRPSDLAALVNLASGERLLPTDASEFERKYVETKKHSPGLLGRIRGAKPGETQTLKNSDALKEILGKWVDYHENTKDGFPERRDTVVNVPLTGRQLETYEAVLGEAPSWVRHKVRNNLPMSKQETKELNGFLSGTRQVATSLGGHAKDLTPEQIADSSSKIQAAVSRLKERAAKDPQHKALVYSNYLEAGLDPYETALKREKIPYGKFTGEMAKHERDQVVNDYNSGRLKALLLSSAGGEGLDLKGTRQIQVLEPHFNKEKLEQVIARGIRYKSHEGLAPEAQNVDVEHYVSTLPEPGMLKRMVGKKRDTGVDEYLRTLSANKDRLNQQIRDLLKKPTE